MPGGRSRLSGRRRRAAASATLALLITLAASATGSVGVDESTAATFGKTTIGASSDTFRADRKRVSRFSLAVAGEVAKLSIYLAPTSTSGQQSLQGIIYADSAGAPGALLAVSRELVYHSGEAAGWRDLAFASPVALSAGSYWIGVITGATTGVAGFRYDSVSGSRDYNTNTYTAGPSNPFGTVTTDSELASLYATYAPSSVPVPANESPPTITGTAEEGQTLSEHNGKWTNEPTSYSYQWLQCESLGASCLPISGATGATYKPGMSDVGHTIEVEEIAKNAGGSSAPAFSAPTATVAAEPAPVNESPPTIKGAAVQGSTLTAEPGTWSNEPSSYAYKWERCNSSGEGCGYITGAESTSYTLTANDVGATIRVVVAAANDGGSSQPAPSAPTPLVQAGSSATFGKTSVGALSDSFTASRKRVNRYALPVAGDVAKLSIYLAATATSGQQVLEGLIYADSSGAPSSLLAVSAQLTFKSTNAAGWYDLTFPTPVKLAAGNYWIGVLTGATGGVAGFRYDSVSGSRDYNGNTYSSGPSNPFGTPKTDAEQMSLYATYTGESTGGDTSPPSQPQGLGARAIGPRQVNLSWSPASDNVGVTGYTIKRDGAVVGNAEPAATEYTDQGLALSPASSHSYTVEAFDAAGNRSAPSASAAATTLAATSIQHYEYVFPSNAIDVYDMDNGQKLLKTIALPAAASDIRGAVASPATHVLYVSYGGDGGSEGGGTLLAYDLVAEKTLWTHLYSEGIDSMAITPDGRTIFMPVGESSTLSSWNVIEAATGTVTGHIEGGLGPHNTIVSLDGQHVYMGPRNAGRLTVADVFSDRLVQEIGPVLNNGVRPFTINGRQTLAFTTATGYLGFQVESITTGKVLYTVPVTGPFPYTAGQPGPSSPSHGISLSPDEKELYVMDQPNSYVHVFDVSGLPGSPPTQIANIALTRQMTGSQAGCTYDCLREGWLQHTLDGRYVYVGDSGDVIDTATRQSVANLEPLYNSRVFLEIDWSGGVPVATSSRSGVGYLTN